MKATLSFGDMPIGPAPRSPEYLCFGWLATLAEMYDATSLRMKPSLPYALTVVVGGVSTAALDAMTRFLQSRVPAMVFVQFEHEGAT
jgi:hypothetical protein